MVPDVKNRETTAVLVYDADRPREAMLYVSVSVPGDEGDRYYHLYSIPNIEPRYFQGKEKMLETTEKLNEYRTEVSISLISRRERVYWTGR